jgi:hypothetical protein
MPYSTLMVLLISTNSSVSTWVALVSFYSSSAASITSRFTAILKIGELF